MNKQIEQKTLDCLPDYIKLFYNPHAIKQSNRPDRMVFECLPNKVKKENITIIKGYFENEKLLKVVFQIEVESNTLNSNYMNLELVYIPDSKRVITVYKTRKQEKN